MNKIKNKLSSWKNRYLSVGGRITLLKSVLRNLPIYYISLFRVPSGVGKTIEKLMRKFLWEGIVDRSRIHLVKWEDICHGKKFGGIGIGSVKDKNAALLAKWWWRFGYADDSLWKTIVCDLRGWKIDRWLPLETSNRGCSKVWKDILQVPNLDPWFKSLVLEGFAAIHGNGHKTRFWKDI